MPRCYDCYRPLKNCLCEEIVPMETKVQICLLMHPMEAKKQRVGTGRLTHCSLPNSRIIVGVDFTNDKEVNYLIENRQCFILYPGAEAVNLGHELLPEEFNTPNNVTIFVVDATWPMAKKMMRESKNLHHLPQVCFEPSFRSRFSIKHQPHQYCLSTIESTYSLLKALENHRVENLNHKAENLLRLLDLLVEFQVKCASDPNLKGYRKSPYTNQKQREARSRPKKSRLYNFNPENY